MKFWLLEHRVRMKKANIFVQRTFAATSPQGHPPGSNMNMCMENFPRI